MTQQHKTSFDHSSEPPSTLIAPRRYQNMQINGQVEELQSFFEQVCQSFACRKQDLGHMVNQFDKQIKKIEDQLSEFGQREIDLEGRFSEIEQSINKKLATERNDLEETRSILKEFITKEWVYFHQVCKDEAADERALILNIISTSKKRVEELRKAVQREKSEGQKGACIVKIHNLLKQKCLLLEKQLLAIKDNTAKCKKEAQKLIKTMLRILQEIQDGREDRESKEACILDLIERMDKEEVILDNP